MSSEMKPSQRVIKFEADALKVIELIVKQAPKAKIKEA